MSENLIKPPEDTLKLLEVAVASNLSKDVVNPLTGQALHLEFRPTPGNSAASTEKEEEKEKAADAVVQKRKQTEEAQEMAAGQKESAGLDKIKNAASAAFVGILLYNVEHKEEKKVEQREVLELQKLLNEVLDEYKDEYKIKPPTPEAFQENFQKKAAEVGLNWELTKEGASTLLKGAGMDIANTMRQDPTLKP